MFFQGEVDYVKYVVQDESLKSVHSHGNEVGPMSSQCCPTIVGNDATEVMTEVCYGTACHTMLDCVAYYSNRPYKCSVIGL